MYENVWKCVEMYEKFVKMCENVGECLKMCENVRKCWNPQSEIHDVRKFTPDVTDQRLWEIEWRLWRIEWRLLWIKPLGAVRLNN